MMSLFSELAYWVVIVVVGAYLFNNYLLPLYNKYKGRFGVKTLLEEEKKQ